MYKVTASDVELLERIIQDIGDHELANAVVQLHAKCRRERDICTAVLHTGQFVVTGMLFDSEGWSSWSVEAAGYLHHLDDKQLFNLLVAEGSDDMNGLYDYYGRESNLNVPAFGCRCVRELDATLNEDVGACSSVNMEDLKSWTKQHRPDVWRRYVLEYGEGQGA
jgi:hypothetical protein